MAGLRERREERDVLMFVRGLDCAAHAQTNVRYAKPVAYGTTATDATVPNLRGIAGHVPAAAQGPFSMDAGLSYGRPDARAPPFLPDPAITGKAAA